MKRPENIWIFDFVIKNIFMISTEVCDAISKNNYIITSFSYPFTVSLSSRYNFLSFIYILIFWASVYNSSWSFMCC